MEIPPFSRAQPAFAARGESAVRRAACAERATSATRHAPHAAIFPLIKLPSKPPSARSQQHLPYLALPPRPLDGLLQSRGRSASAWHRRPAPLDSNDQRTSIDCPVPSTKLTSNSNHPQRQRPATTSPGHYPPQRSSDPLTSPTMSAASTHAPAPASNSTAAAASNATASEAVAALRLVYRLGRSSKQ
jgi:hypothetical protein